MWRHGSILIVVLVGVVTFAPARADLSFSLTREFSGASPPAATESGVWLRATFQDVAQDTVRLRLENLLVGTEEHIKSWYFNIEPFVDDLAFTCVSGAVPASIAAGLNAFKADGDGYFDILLEWPRSASDENRFDSSHPLAVFDITGSGISASSFDHLSVGAGNSPGGLYTAAHVGGIGPEGEDSGWITVPVPGAALLGAIGLTAVGLLKRRFE